jgi:transposase
LYLDRAGCAWRYLPSDFPPWQTVYGYFAAWRDDGTLTRLHDALRAQVRAAAGRNAEPTAAIIDSQSVRAADTVPKASRGWDNAKKVNGRKRHIAVDAMGLVLTVVITAASVQDRDGARPLLWNLHHACRRIRLIWADAAYTGKLAAWAAALKITVQVVARREQHVFEVLPRRWVVERTFAWISKHRRTVRDYEQLPASHEAMILWAMVVLMARRLTLPNDLSDAHLASGMTPCSGIESRDLCRSVTKVRNRGRLDHLPRVRCVRRPEPAARALPRPCSFVPDPG